MKKLIIIGIIYSNLASAVTPPPAQAPLTLTNPISVNKVYDKLWISGISINSPSPSGEAQAVLTLKPEIKSTGELAPDQMAISLSIPDIFNRIANGDKQLAQIMGLILDYASKEAKKQGKL